MQSIKKQKNGGSKYSFNQKQKMDFIVRYTRGENVFLGLMLICPAILMDYIAIDTEQYKFLIFTVMMTIFLGFFAYIYISNGLQRKIIILFNEEGIESYNPAFNVKWSDVFGYKLHEYSGGNFKTLEIDFLFNNGKTSTTINVSWSDKKKDDFDKYLSKKLKKISNKDYTETFEKKFN